MVSVIDTVEVSALEISPDLRRYAIEDELFGQDIGILLAHRQEQTLIPRPY